MTKVPERNVTQWLVPNPCSYEGCNRTGLYVAVVDGENWSNSKLYCREHVLTVQKEEADLTE